MPITTPPLATDQDGTYPRPQMLRAAWRDLSGTWAFRHDDDRVGLDGGWERGFAVSDPGSRPITVPFPPESEASGVDEPGYHPVVWYSRSITGDDLADAGRSDDARRVLLHFGAVDFAASVWIDGLLVGTHEGGHTPFSFDVTRFVAGDGAGTDDVAAANEHVLVVRAEDDPLSTTQPRGKQEWLPDPHVIWYRRTTGIWQPVWLEAVPVASIRSLRWSTHDHDRVRLHVRLDGAPVPPDAELTVDLRADWLDEDLAHVSVRVPQGLSTSAASEGFDVELRIDRQRNGQSMHDLFWGPDHPRLVDATVSLRTADRAPLDVVSSYLGLRTTTVEQGRFLLTGHPIDVRSVLEQGYWPTSHLAAPSPDALREEVELVKELGFNACRIHQKIEDPRFLFWTDTLGVMVWGEAPAASGFSPLAVQRLTREWMDVLDRDTSHPSIVTWVPFNESWGIDQVASDPAQQAYSRALSELARALDPSRPVVSNDGWEHSGSDIVTVHDYDGDGASLARSFSDDAARTALFETMQVNGRHTLVGGALDHGQPVMLTEFGGLTWAPKDAFDNAFGYTRISNQDDYLRVLRELYDAVRASDFLAGSCYTQLTDTLQETNGLLNADRTPKAPIEAIRAAITGQ